MRKPEADMLSTPARAEAAPYESASELRDAHSRLLDRLDDELGAEGEPQRAESEALAKLEAPIREFLARGVATGLFLDEPKERTACQVLLDYWASSLSRHGMRVGALRLARFDAGQLPDLADK